MTSTTKPRADWEAIERDYRTGKLSDQELADKHKNVVTRQAISKRAKTKGWTKDLTEQIQKRPAQRVTLPPSDPMERAGFVYVIFIDVAGDRFFKIGFAAEFCARFDRHQCASPFEIQVACAYFVGDMRAEERAVHQRFREQNVRGEWFRLSAADLIEIGARALLV